MAHFTKLWSSIVASSVWNEDDQTRIVWITMLSMAEAGGFVGGAVPGLAHLSRVSVEACRKALARLESPDEESRTKDFGGRRIATVDGGWQILNYEKHREAVDEDQRREQTRERMRKLRERRRVRGVTQSDARLRQAEAEAEAYKGLSSLRSDALFPSGPERAQETNPPKDRGEPSRSARGKGKAKKAEPDPRHRVFVKFWCEEWEKKHGGKYPFSAKDAGIMKQLIATAPKNECCHVMLKYLDDEDWFVTREKHPLSLLLRRVQVYTAADGEETSIEEAMNLLGEDEHRDEAGNVTHRRRADGSIESLAQAPHVNSGNSKSGKMGSGLSSEG